MAKRLPKTTKMQYEELLNFVEQNKILLRGKITASKADKIEKLWQEFAVKINAKGLGAPKTARQWRKVGNFTYTVKFRYIVFTSKTLLVIHKALFFRLFPDTLPYF